MPAKKTPRSDNFGGPLIQLMNTRQSINILTRLSGSKKKWECELYFCVAFLQIE